MGMGDEGLTRLLPAMARGCPRLTTLDIADNMMRFGGETSQTERGNIKGLAGEGSVRSF